MDDASRPNLAPWWTQTCQASLRRGMASALAMSAVPPPPSFRPSSPITSAAVQ